MECCSSSNTPLEGNKKIIVNPTPFPEKDHEIQSAQSSKGEVRKMEPEWLECFFKRVFFEQCPAHFIRRNELNKYCIDCDAPLCQFCLSQDLHRDHKLLKLYRHVYKDVVPIDEIGRYIDCSEIQPYRCNKQRVIALTPLPHTGCKTNNVEELCETCKRKLIDYNIYSYCSISCKVEAFTSKEDDDCPPFLSLNPSVQKSKEDCEPKKSAADELVQQAQQKPEWEQTIVDQLRREAEPKPEMQTTALDQETAYPEPVINFRTRKRKGTPHRAPFF